MPRKISFEFSGFPSAVTATLLDDEERDFADKLWAELEQPLKMWPWHTTSTGDWFGAKGRPPRERQIVGSQASPLGRSRLMCDIEQGAIVYSGPRILSFAYGPDVSEPLRARGTVVARADNLDEFYRAGRHVWNAQYRTHELVIVTARRES
jgi:hypothetical protein